ncbi:MAG: GNAT family N-acetyltransferase [Burkholderiaceae bacterium]|nr:GNAT family N-acetyltransferase [Burkholderiaceae bacterium]
MRAATAADLPAMVALGEVMHAEGRYRTVSFDRGRVADALAFAMREGIVIVAESGGELVGGVALLIVPYFFSAERMATDLALFVAPGARGGAAAVKLVSTATDAAVRAGAREVVFSSSVGIDPERFGHFMTHLGFIQQGGVYSMEA